MAESNVAATETSILLGVVVAVLGGLLLLAAIWSLTSRKCDQSERWEDEAEVKPKASKTKAMSKAAQAKAKSEKAKANPSPSQSPPQSKSVSAIGSVSAVADAPEERRDSDVGVEPPEETPTEKSPKKKKRRKPAKTEVEDEDEAAEEADASTAAIASPANDVVEKQSPELDGWTVVTQKQKLVADTPEAEEEQKRIDKICDLRRRKSHVLSQIKRLEEGLGSISAPGRKDDAECKALETRGRLQEDLDRINRAILRISKTGQEDNAEAPAEWDDGAEQDCCEGEGQWDHWDDWDAADDWHAWGQNQSWEEAAAVEEDWHEGGHQGDWWYSSNSSWSGAGGKGKKRRGRRADSWWEADAFWDAAADTAWDSAGHPATSSWHDAQNQWWEGCEWADGDSYNEGSQSTNWHSTEPRRRGRRRGKGEKGGDSHRESTGEQHQDFEGVERQEGRGKYKEDNDNSQAEDEHDEERHDRRRNKGKGKGDKGNAKGKDKEKGKGKGRDRSKGGKGKGRVDDAGDFEEWQRQRLGNQAPREREEKETADQDDASAEAEEVNKNNLFSLFANRNSDGHRQNWGDAESSEDDTPAMVRPFKSSLRRESKDSRESRESKDAEAPTRNQPTIEATHDPPRSGESAVKQSTTSEAPRSVVAASSEDSAWDEDLVAFMGEAALADEAKFEEQLKYVPTWVREKALRRRKQLMRPVDS